MPVGNQPRDKKDCFRSRKGIKRREISVDRCKRKGMDVEVVVKSSEAFDYKNCFELRGRRIVERCVETHIRKQSWGGDPTYCHPTPM